MSPPTGQKTSWLGYNYGTSPLTLTASTNTINWKNSNQFLRKDANGWTATATYNFKLNPATGNWDVHISQEVLPPEAPVKKTRRGHKHKLRVPELEIGDLE